MPPDGDERGVLDLKPSSAPAVQQLLHGSAAQPPPARLVVFGATGDLAAVGGVRDALIGLAEKGEHGGLEPEKHPVILVARKPTPFDGHLEHLVAGRDGARLSDEQRKKLKALVARSATRHGELQHIDFAAEPKALAERLNDLLGDESAVGYAALPPSTFDEVMKAVKAAGVDRPKRAGAFRRLLLEKPFGDTPEHAHALAKYIRASFAPGQVLLIDHFLPMLSNILAVRTNPVVDAALSNRHVRAVRAFMREKIASNDRPYFRSTGLLLDVVQNHVMMLLATTVADLPPPERLTADALRSARAEVLEHIAVDCSSARKGQFEGFNDPQQGAPVDSKTGEVKPSQAETFVAFELSVNTARWRGVRFSVEAAKAAANDAWGVELDLELTDELARLSGAAAGADAMLRALIFPEHEISLHLADGPTFELPVDRRGQGASPYERLFRDALKGDAAMFNALEEPLAAWDNVVAPVQRALANKPLETYPRGRAPTLR
jgi:glucose-6-phosphate 1-dehydrogenase